MAERRSTKPPDPPLVALLVAQQLVPITALALYARGYRPSWLVAIGVLAWIITTVQAMRHAAVARTARKAAVSDAAWGIARRSAARVRGGAHDALLEVVWRGISARASLAAETTPATTASLIALPIAFVLAIVVDGRDVAFAAVAAALAGVLARVPLARAYRARIDELNAAHSLLAIDLGHGLRALEDLQAHGLAEPFAARLDDHAQRMAEAESAAVRAGRAAMLGPLIAGSAAFVAVLWRSIGTPSVGLLHLATLGALGPIALVLARGIVSQTRLRADAAALDALATRPPDLPAPSSPEPLTTMTPIECRRVSFRHPGPSRSTGQGRTLGAPPDGAAVFEDITLRWSGERPLAIVGANGSGKSTLLMLLLRLVDPDRGEVTFGGVDLRHADPRELRPRIAYVPQRPLLLEGMTVGEAMRLVAPDAEDARLVSALERVRLAERLRTRSDQPLEVPCASLSVGEAQRIAIARALARDAELLVLDEPEASLDPGARAELRALLESLAGEGKKIVLASQHADVVPKEADRLELPLPRGTTWPAAPE